MTDWANVVSAAATTGAVVWGIWQVVSERRRVREEQRAAIHEIAAASERIAIIWDNMAVAQKETDWEKAGYQFRRSLQECEETLDRLMRRSDLTDGTVRCGVGARQFAKALIEQSAPGSGQAYQIEFEQERAQIILDKARRLRRLHGINEPRRPHSYVKLAQPTKLPKTHL